jgi:myo-inositol-1(or 4)-monophosphatase
MEIEELLAISKELRDYVRAYLSETTDYGEVLVKKEGDVTRKIDMFAERALERALERRNLCARIISEELGDHIFPKGGEPEFTLIFDPIDGSTNAILGIPFFCSSLAYSSDVNHVTFASIKASVVATYYGKTYYAVRGGNAFVDGKELPCDVKGKTKQVYSIYTYGAESVPKSVMYFQKGSKHMIIRVLGSIAAELCLVAEGVIDGLIDVRGSLSGYDIAGASLILKEAGGIVTDLQSKTFEDVGGQAQKISLIAALKPEIYKGILDMMI